MSAELWKQCGEFGRAAEGYRAALLCECTEPERRFLESQLKAVLVVSLVDKLLVCVT